MFLLLLQGRDTITVFANEEERPDSCEVWDQIFHDPALVLSLIIPANYRRTVQYKNGPYIAPPNCCRTCLSVFINLKNLSPSEVIGISRQHPVLAFGTAVGSEWLRPPMSQPPEHGRANGSQILFDLRPFSPVNTVYSMYRESATTFSRHSACRTLLYKQTVLGRGGVRKERKET